MKKVTVEQLIDILGKPNANPELVEAANRKLKEHIETAEVIVDQSGSEIIWGHTSGGTQFIPPSHTGDADVTLVNSR